MQIVQELLRHGSAKITMDVYAQVQMPVKRMAQKKVFEMMLPEMRQRITTLGSLKTWVLDGDLKGFELSA